MQFTYPGVSDEEFAKKSGGAIADSLKIDEKNYQTTAPVEERALSFAEVKKDIDAGGIVKCMETTVSPLTHLEQEII